MSRISNLVRRHMAHTHIHTNQNTYNTHKQRASSRTGTALAAAGELMTLAALSSGLASAKGGVMSPGACVRGVPSAMGGGEEEGVTGGRAGEAAEVGVS